VSDDELADNKETNTSLPTESRALLMFLFLWQTIYKVSDNGISVLLKFIVCFLSIIGSLSNGQIIVEFAKCLPTSLYMAKSVLDVNEDKFEKFVSCPKCMTRYNYNECTIKKSNGTIASKKCCYIRFPKHPQKTRRTECGTLLMKKVRSKSGSLYLRPKRMYCYRSLISCLNEMFSRTGFLDKCDEWKYRNINDESMGDVFEGRIWKNFVDAEGKKFFSSLAHNFGVMMNVDWFQPYKHINHSCGVIYLVLMNLPREERFKLENVIIVGIIPGPNEPKGNINSFLEPLVDELLDLWNGMIITSKDPEIGLLRIRVALLALCCDIPAARKCGGFAGHSALRGRYIYPTTS